MTKKIWKARSPTSGDLVTQLLANRGLADSGDVERFFDPRYENAFDPFLFQDMAKAAPRVAVALEQKEKITVYADYDADAVTAAAVLLRFFKKIGHQNLDYYIPDRFAEGYGINAEAVKTLADRGTKLIITVDCGINAFEAVALAETLGIDVIVTDHHQQIGPDLPHAVAVINPHRLDESYPFKDLTGVGVAFKFVQGIVKMLGEQRLGIPKGWEKWLLDLVAIGTVADCQTLLGENRIFVKWGLEVLRKTHWSGLRELVAKAGLDKSALDTYHLGFVIAPRINAAGRLEHASLALELLLTDDSAEGVRQAARLDDLNKRRQDLTEQILSEAREQLAALSSQKILLASGEGWPKGIVGLVAGKLAEEFYRPVLVVERGEREATGSARSIRGFNIIEAISHSQQILVKYGGHPMAAGFTLLTEHIETFHKNLLGHAEKLLTEEDLAPIIYYDAELKLSEVTDELLELVEKFAPFGQGNPRPRFRINRVAVGEAKPIGAAGKHLRLLVEGDGVKLTSVAFNQGYWAKKLVPGANIDLVCEVQYNEWNGDKKLQLKIIDLDFSNPHAI